MFAEKGYTQQLVSKIQESVMHVVKEQETVFYQTMTAMLSGGHVLLEGFPGLGKTLLVRAIAQSISADFKRVQFTSDLMPSDIIGTKIYNLQTSVFEQKKGPLFTNLFLADEINRTPPKTQSALLEVMEERTITIDGISHKLSELFFVCATQNPIEFEGTYPLPEALLDRFMMKILIGYPGESAEVEVLKMYHDGFNSANLDEHVLNNTCTADELLLCKDEINAVCVDIGIMHYIQKIVDLTRKTKLVLMGSSPRGAISLLLAAKTYAAISGRDFVTPDDIKELAVPVLRHRIILTPEAEIDGYKTDSIIEKILTFVKVPR